jgi:ribosomal protein S18 acetylase RimI-like enzyme
LGTQNGRKGGIKHLAVDKDFRRRKTAQILLNTVEKQFKMDGLEVYACLIEAQNDTSMKFFEKSGYYKSPGILYCSKRKNGEV